MIRPDITFPERAVKLFAQSMTHDLLFIRKLSTNAVCTILKIQKRHHSTFVIDPYVAHGSKQPLVDAPCSPGDRPDNKWIHYDSTGQDIKSLSVKEVNESASDAETNQMDCAAPQSIVGLVNCSNIPGDFSTIMVHKTHWGFYCWPQKMLAYSPSEEQPALSRKYEDLSLEEKPIFECFTSETFLKKFMNFLVLEESKGKDKFHAKFFTLLKVYLRHLMNLCWRC